MSSPGQILKSIAQARSAGHSTERDAGRVSNGLPVGRPPWSALDAGVRLDAPSSQAPLTIGTHTIDREIGRGGMGVVYLARDTQLDRPVAIKALPEPDEPGTRSDPAFSPDGTWVAYRAGGSGRFEAYLRPVDPERPESAPIHPVSATGGAHPLWSREVGSPIDALAGYDRLVCIQRPSDIDERPALHIALDWPAEDRR